MLKIKYFGYSASLGFAVWKGRTIRECDITCEIEFRIWPATCFELDRPGQNHNFRVRVTSYHSTRFYNRQYYSINLYCRENFRYSLVEVKIYQLTECIRLEFVNEHFFLRTWD
jgi:hypothetical protein